jgi:hypothetical protein
LKNNAGLKKKSTKLFSLLRVVCLTGAIVIMLVGESILDKTDQIELFPFASFGDTIKLTSTIALLLTILQLYPTNDRETTNAYIEIK